MCPLQKAQQETKLGEQLLAYKASDAKLKELRVQLQDTLQILKGSTSQGEESLQEFPPGKPSPCSCVCAVMHLQPTFALYYNLKSARMHSVKMLCCGVKSCVLVISHAYISPGCDIVASGQVPMSIKR